MSNKNNIPGGTPPKPGQPGAITDGQPSTKAVATALEKPSSPNFEIVKVNLHGDINMSNAMPNFKRPSQLKFPSLLKDLSGRLHVLENGHLIDKAMANGLLELSCMVTTVPEILSEAELGIEKWNTRVQSPNGFVSSAEHVRNVKIAVKLLDDTGEYTPAKHGGSHEYNSKDPLQFIANKLGKKRKTIVDLYRHSQDLSDDLLDHLVQCEAPQEFFEKVSKVKDAASKAAKQDGVTDKVEITKRVSEKVLEAFHAKKEEAPEKKKSKELNTPVDVFSAKVAPIARNLAKSATGATTLEGLNKVLYDAESDIVELSVNIKKAIELQAQRAALADPTPGAKA